ncbi:stage III sporulation protein AH [Gracilibacillus halophilus YIM-C55.5]|uniref:Stage III sporulation protein AH n=1 Tax=Gracilibacillus halophilus YIM-C55.5 TaxID=1308866 RepID=N4WSU4_9BACI|nr:SpoIIIAH-like family protein [Gracilibacillus halophilus]ENH97435.1 stage III sporulation protein AH [Gracilibacillus halophilus YIM-C55.5]
MLKKQTVWLLTMLSLMIVLSVYYLNAPNEGDLAYSGTEDTDSEQMTSPTIEESVENVETQGENKEASNADSTGEEGTETSSISTEEYFSAVRMNMTNQRSMEKERLQSIVSSSDATSEEKKEAYEAMKEIETVESKETILEDTIQSLNGYEEVLVRNISDQDVVITVQTDELSSKEANTIIQHAKDEFGEINIEVVYQSS